MFYEWSKFVEGYFNNENLVIIEKMPEKRKHLENIRPTVLQSYTK